MEAAAASSSTACAFAKRFSRFVWLGGATGVPGPRISLIAGKAVIVTNSSLRASNSVAPPGENALVFSM